VGGGDGAPFVAIVVELMIVINEIIDIYDYFYPNRSPSFVPLIN
jgi:hypothetical protein